VSLRRELVVDANLDKRIAGELRHRGRAAVSVHPLGFGHLKDPELLQRLAELYRPEAWVLVTGDDRMPADHGELIERLGVTIATIDPVNDAEHQIDEWRRDVVHRWAHVMQEQAQGSVRRYSLRQHRAWAPRRRPRRH
jgi:hypothetical protein